MFWLFFCTYNNLKCGGKVTPPYDNICVGMEESKIRLRQKYGLQMG